MIHSVMLKAKNEQTACLFLNSMLKIQHVEIDIQHVDEPTQAAPSVSKLTNRVTSLPLGLDRTRGVVEHSKLQSRRSNPNARRQLGVLTEGSHPLTSKPGTESTGGSHLPQARQVTIVGQDWGSALAVVPNLARGPANT
jgi:hypothetical protein